MIKYLLVGVALFCAFAIAFLPASMVQGALQQAPDTRLNQPAGSLWSGQGELQVREQRLGWLQWQFQPLSLLQLKPTYALRLGDLQANLGYSMSGLHIDLQGELPVSVLQPTLDQHQLVIGGRLNAQSLIFELDPNNPWSTLSGNGSLDWTGGPVSYFIANDQNHAILPPLRLNLVEPSTDPISGRWQLQAEVYNQTQTGEDAEPKYALMTLALNPQGLVKVSITKRLTQLVGSPWPGSDPDHATILEVEQPLF